MATLVYSSLPTVKAADQHVKALDMDTILFKMASVLARYGDQFGLGLVHHHFDLADDEQMVDDGLISKPLKKGTKRTFAKRYTREGVPYEYSLEPQPTLPPELVKAVKDIIPEKAPLGLYSRTGDDEEVNVVEINDAKDRSHIMVPRDSPELQDEHPSTWITTCWYAERGANDALKMATPLNKKAFCVHADNGAAPLNRNTSCFHAHHEAAPLNKNAFCVHAEHKAAPLNENTFCVHADQEAAPLNRNTFCVHADREAPPLNKSAFCVHADHKAASLNKNAFCVHADDEAAPLDKKAFCVHADDEAAPLDKKAFCVHADDEAAPLDKKAFCVHADHSDVQRGLPK